MPFTFAHPGYLLWVKHKWENISISAIVISSMVPDFDILFRITDTRIHIFRYDIKTIFLYILPISFFLWIFYEYILKKIYISIFPIFRTSNSTIKELPFVILLMMVSILAHIFLDLISHWNAQTLFMIVGWNSGNIIMSSIMYFFSLYGVGVLFSGLGFYLILKYLKSEYDFNYDDIKQISLNQQQLAFIVCYVLTVLFFFIVKFSFAIKESIFIVDIVIINFTSALVFSFFVAPIFYILYPKSTKECCK